MAGVKTVRGVRRVNEVHETSIDDDLPPSEAKIA